MNESGGIDPFAYTDLKVYLRDHYDDQKRRRKSFSYRQFAAKAQTAPSLYKEVVEGRRGLTAQAALKFARALGLESKAREYFLWMAKLAGGRTPEEKSSALARMGALRKKSAPRRLEPDQYEVFRDWHHCAIRELAALSTFREDPAWIADQLTPPIAQAQARRSLELLLSIGLLGRDGKGRVVQTEPAFTGEDDRLSASVREYHRQMLTLARESLDRLPLPQREVGGATLCTSRKVRDQIRDRMRIFREEILSLVVEDSDPPEAVWQLHLSLFPLSRQAATGEAAP